MLDQLAAVDPRREARIEAEDPVETQDVRDQVVGEHRQPVEVTERGDAGPAQVSRGDLRALEKRDLELFVARAVAKHGHAPSSEASATAEPSCGVSHSRERTIELGRDAAPELVERARVERHQLVVGRLPEDLRDGGRIELGHLRGGPGAVALDAVAQGGRDRAVAGVAGALSQRRKPARAKVDRVESEPERGSLFAASRAAVVRRPAGPSRA